MLEAATDAGHNQRMRRAQIQGVDRHGTEASVTRQGRAERC